MAPRSPIELDPEKALFATIKQAIRIDPVRLAMSAYLEGAGLEGGWTLEITSARLVPVESPVEP